MYDIGKILKRAWEIVWKYKVLWVFGLLLVLSGVGGSSGGGGNNGGRLSYSNNFDEEFRNGRYNFGDYYGFDDSHLYPQWVNDMITWAQEKVVPLFATPEKAIQTAIWMGVILVGFSIVMGLLLALIRYPSETAVIRMVDEYEGTGAKVKFKEGWKLGWNKRAFRTWLVDLLINLPALLLVAILVGGGILIALSAENTAESVWVGLAGGILLLILFFLAFALFMIALGMLREFVVRFVAIDGVTVGEGFSKGWQMFKRNFKDIFITWLVMVGFGIAFGVAIIIAFFVLIPAYGIMAVPGAIVAAIPGGIAYGIASIFSSAAWMPWVIGGLVALPFFFTVVFLPLSFVCGWYVIFGVNVWTLAFRQFKYNASLPQIPVEIPPAIPPMNAGK